MKAFLATAPQKLELVERPIPEPAMNEVLVKTKAVGICGSDIHLFRGDHPYTTYPMIFGHEASGVVEAVGSDVIEFTAGEHVVLEPLIPCGKCYPCSIGRRNCCSNMKTVGVTTNGALAEYFSVPDFCIHKIPEDLSFSLAALAEPFSIGFQAASRGAVEKADQVAIIGSGTIGLTILAAAKQASARVLISDIMDFRLEIAQRMGADVIVNSQKENLADKVMEWTNGFGASVVVEAVGMPSTIESTIGLVADAGRIVIAGVTKEKFAIRGVDVTKKELTISGSRNNLGKFGDAINFILSKPEVAENLITHTYAFDETPIAFETANEKPGETCKVMIDFDLLN
jgi:2-desacetyl-2-hydroxyethyl bacteriochlorophyllide A dehydrogenase